MKLISLSCNFISFSITIYWNCEVKISIILLFLEIYSTLSILSCYYIFMFVKSCCIRYHCALSSHERENITHHNWNLMEAISRYTYVYSMYGICRLLLDDDGSGGLLGDNDSSVGLCLNIFLIHQFVLFVNQILKI